MKKIYKNASCDAKKIMNGFKYLLFISCMFMAGSVWGQSTANYAFTTNTTGSLALDANGNAVDMTTGTTAVAGASADNNGPFSANIGFNFIFMGTSYDQINTSGNGVFRLSNISNPVTISTALYASGTTASQALIAPFARDLSTSTSGSILTKIVGSAPNRCFIIQYTNMEIDWNSSTSDGTYQARLYESSGVIEYVYGSMSVGVGGGTTGYSLGFSSSNTANSFVSITSSTNTVSRSTVTTNTYTAGATIPNLNSSSNGSRRVYRFTPTVTSIAGPTNLTFASVTTTGMTLNWTAASPTTGIVRYIVQRSTDGGVTYPVSSNVALGTNTFAVTGLSPGTNYTYRVVAVSEGVESTSTATGTQATTAGATYYWVGDGAGADFNTASNWNTLANGTGTGRTNPLATDVLIVDGATTVAGSAAIITLATSSSCGQFLITNNTTVTVTSTTTATRSITINGGGGLDLSIPAGSTLNLTNANPAAFAFNGTGNTGDISGTYNASSKISNVITTTGGTGTLVTVSATGVVNNSIVGISGCLAGSATTLSFANGSQYNVSGATTDAPWIPLATWGANSTITVSGLTTSTTAPTNASQTFGNLTINCPLLTASHNWVSSATIQGDLNVTTGSGNFRLVSSGTATINGNVLVNAGTFTPFSSSGSVIVQGNTTINSGATMNLSLDAGTYSQRGATFTNNGTLIGGGTTTGGTLQIFSPSNAAMTLAGTGTVSTALTTLSVQSTGGLTISHTNQIPVLRTNLFTGTVTNSNKITMGTGAALAVTFQTGSTGSTNNGGTFDQSPTWNLGTGTYSLIYSQELGNRTTGFEIPPTRTVNNITNSNSNGLTINGGALSSAALTLSSGCGNITTSGANILRITGTTTSAITRTSTTAYINGPLELTLPASLTGSSVYLFPIGKSLLKPFELTTPITTAGGTVVVRAEVFDGNSGGTAGNIMGSISANRYWEASIISGAANYTSSHIRLTDETTGFDAIGGSSTLNGAYDLIGGSAATVSATSITTVTPVPSTLLGFYCMGAKAAATLSNLTITPSGNLCTNALRDITVTATPGGGAVTGVTLNYSINGVAQTAINMTNTSGNDWTGQIPVVSPTNANVTWSVTATDANSLTKSATGTAYKDEPNFGATATATASPSTLCTGSNTNLELTLNTSGISVPSGYTTTGLGGSATPYVSLLTLNTLSYTANSSAVSPFYKSMPFSGTSTTSLTLGQTIIATVNTASAAIVSIWVDFNRNGTFESSEWFQPYTNASSGTVSIIVPSNVSVGQTRMRIRTRGIGSPNGSGDANTNFFSGEAIDFTITLIPPATAFSWSDGTTTVGTTNPLSTTVSGNTTYTCTATVNSCPMTASVTPTVNSLPIAPTATNSSQCGAGVPTASVADNNSYTTPTFKWYSAASGGTLLQSSASTTYIPSISTTTTFYVAVVNASTGCESARTAVTVSVTQPDAISATTSAASICLGQSVTLTAANTASTPTQNYSYSWLCATTGSGATSANTSNPASITPSAAGSYTYTVTGTDGACSAINTVAVTVNALPNITSATATPATVCSGSTITLTGANTTSVNYSSARTAPTNIANTTPFSYGLVFNVTTAFTLNSVDVFNGTTSSGTFVIQLQNSGGTVLQTSSTFTAPAGTGVIGTTVAYTANLGWNIPIGTGYRLLVTSGTASLIRESSLGGFPYSIGSVGSITSGYLNGTSTTYYYLYNWQVTSTNDQTSLYSWSWNSTPAVTSATGTTTETNTGASATNKTYTVTATNASTGCTNTVTTSAVTFNPAPIAPAATYSTQCGTLTPTCSVTGSGISGNTFRWYTEAIGGSSITGQNVSTLSAYPVSTSTSFYVSESNGTCESPRTQVDVTVTTPPTISVAATVNPVCSGSPTLLSASSSNTGYTYAWSNSLGSGASVTVSPTANTTYTVTATDNSGGANNGCATTGSIAVTTNPIPSVLILSPSVTTGVCNGSIQTISLTSGANGASGSSSSATNSSGTISLSIPDNSVTGVSSSLLISSIPSSATITQVDVTFSLNHTWLNDAELVLIAPNGKVIALAADQGPSSSGSYTNCTITSNNSAASLSTTTTPITGTFKANATAAGSLKGVFGTNLTQNFSDLFSTPNGSWILSAYDDEAGDIGTLTSYSISITYTVPDITWSPITDLYTDVAATTAYTGTAATTLYAKPTANRTYTATATTSSGCTNTKTVQLNNRVPANNVVLASASTTGAVEQCTDANGWSYYATAAKPDEWLFGIYKNGNTFTATVDINVDNANKYQKSASSVGANQEHASYIMSRYWNVNPTGTVGTGVKVRFFIDPQDITDLLDERDNDYDVLKNTTNTSTLAVKGGFEWFKTTNTVYNPTNWTGNKHNGAIVKLTEDAVATLNGQTYVELSGITSFSGGSGGSSFGPSNNGLFSSSGTVGLPVTWKDVKATVKEEGNLIQWTTSSEKNTSHFEVEYSYDAKTFFKASNDIKAAINSTTDKSYDFMHLEEYGELVYYRIKQVDMDAKVDYSKAVVAKRTSKLPEFHVSMYPVPLNVQDLTVRIQTVQKTDITITINDLLGRGVYTERVSPQGYATDHKLSLGHLQNGTYHVTIDNGLNKSVQVLVVGK